MARRKKEEIEIEEIKAPIYPVSPLFSNINAVFANPDTVMLDFGYVGPNYQEPYDLEDTQIARICMPWYSAEVLSKNLSDAISDYKKEQKPKTRKKKTSS